MKDFSQFTAAPIATGGLLRHFSDTRTQEGRVRVVFEDLPDNPQGVLLLAEGPGWSAQQRCGSLNDAALLLACWSQLPQALYLQALGDLERQQQFFGEVGSAA